MAAVSLSRGNPLGVEVIRTLLEHRADPNKVNRQKILAIFSGRFWCLVGNVNPTWLHDSFSQLFFCGIWVGLLRQATSIFALRGLQTDWHRLHQCGGYWQGQGVECECCDRGRIIAEFCPGKSSPRLVRESYKVSMREYLYTHTVELKLYYIYMICNRFAHAYTTRYHKYMLTYVFVYASATWITLLTLWRLLESLARLEVPRRLFKLIKHICTRPKFRVSCDEGKSDFFFQQSGIRQGCPPSAYLFILVMSVMFADIKSRLNTPKQREPIPAIHFSEIIFAESAYYNMNLNHQKCTNRKIFTTKHKSGNTVPRRQQAVHLGSLLTDTVSQLQKSKNALLWQSNLCAVKAFSELS